MGSTKVIHAMYDDDHTLLEAAKKIVGKKIKVSEVFSPCPVHGLDPIIGVKETRLGICAFLYGLTGCLLALVGMYYFMIHDWPMNIGGKPSMAFYLNVPAFIPVTFEVTVLCAAHGMSLTYFLRNKTLPGIPACNPDPRTTDDMFVMEINLDENKKFSSEELMQIVQETGPIELDQKQF